MNRHDAEAPIHAAMHPDIMLEAGDLDGACSVIGLTFTCA